jgi:hypothetical protein
MPPHIAKQCVLPAMPATSAAPRLIALASTHMNSEAEAGGLRLQAEARKPCQAISLADRSLQPYSMKRNDPSAAPVFPMSVSQLLLRLGTCND